MLEKGPHAGASLCRGEGATEMVRAGVRGEGEPMLEHMQD